MLSLVTSGGRPVLAQPAVSRPYPNGPDGEGTRHAAALAHAARLWRIHDKIQSAADLVDRTAGHLDRAGHAVHETPPDTSVLDVLMAGMESEAANLLALAAEAADDARLPIGGAA